VNKASFFSIFLIIVAIALAIKLGEGEGWLGSLLFAGVASFIWWVWDKLFRDEA